MGAHRATLSHRVSYAPLEGSCPCGDAAMPRATVAQADSVAAELLAMLRSDVSTRAAAHRLVLTSQLAQFGSDSDKAVTDALDRTGGQALLDRLLELATPYLEEQDPAAVLGALPYLDALNWIDTLPERFPRLQPHLPFARIPLSQAQRLLQVGGAGDGRPSTGRSGDLATCHVACAAQGFARDAAPALRHAPRNHRVMRRRPRAQRSLDTLAPGPRTSVRGRDRSLRGRSSRGSSSSPTSRRAGRGCPFAS